MKKEAWVISGGGSFVPIAFGALQSEMVRRPEADPEVLAGTSAGALLASVLATAELGREDLNKKVEDFCEILDSIEGNKSIWKRTVRSLFRGLRGLGFRDTSPLQKLLKKHVSFKKLQDSKRKLYVSTYHVNTGQAVLVDQDHPDILDMVLASASFPIFFPPVMREGNYFSDGGIRNNIPSRGVLKERPEVVRIFCCFPLDKSADAIPLGDYEELKADIRWSAKYDLMSLLKQILIGALSELARDDLAHYYHYHKYTGADIQVYFPDDIPLIRGATPLNFDKIRMKQMKEYGFTLKPVSIQQLFRSY